MHSIVYPLWVVMQFTLNEAVEVCEDSKLAPAFSSRPQAEAFIRQHQANWSVHRVTGIDELILLAADLHHIGYHGICIDPEPDGSGGRTVPIAEILASRPGKP
jgi:hypothetical protein